MTNMVSEPCQITWFSYEGGAALHQAAFSEPCQTTWISCTSRRYAPSSVFQSHAKSPCSHSLPPHPPTHGYPRDYSKRLAARPCQSSRPSHPREPTSSRSPRHTRTALLLFSRHSGAHESGGGGVRSARSCPSSVDSFRYAHLLAFAPFQPSNKH